MINDAIEKRLRRERRWFWWRSVGQWLTPILLTGFLGQLVLLGLAAKWPGRAAAFRSDGLILLGVMTLTVVIALLIAWRKLVVSKMRAGQLIDERLPGSKNRLETAGELEQAHDAISAAQKAEAAAYLEQHPIGKFHWSAIWLPLCAALLLFANGASVWRVTRLAPPPPPIAKAAPKIAAAKPSPTPVPFAKIEITAPESEIRATKIEEVVVNATADSDNGFTKISLEATVNGAPRKTIAIDAAKFLHGGATKFDESLLLDELQPEPFDVVAYYFKGSSRHAQPLQVASQMRFIEIRPFREDVMKPPQGADTPAGKAMQAGLVSLQALTKQQIDVTKLTWSVATDVLPQTDPLIVEQQKKIGDAQGNIATKTGELFRALTAAQNEASATVVNHVKLAQEAMQSALGEIKKPALSVANPIQQKAIGELVAATKDLVKVLAKKGQGKPPEEVFKDKQKLKNDQKDDANAMEQLAKIMKKEEGEIQKMEADAQSGGAGAPEKSAAAQQAVSKDLAALREKSQPDPSADGALQEAAQASQNSGEKLAAQDAAGGLSDARAAQSAMARAQAQMQAAATQQMRDALAAAQQQLADAAAQESELNQPGDNAPGGQQGVQGKAQGARGTIDGEKAAQAASGDPQLAKRLEDLSKKFDENKIEPRLDQLVKKGAAASAEQKQGMAADLAKLGQQVASERLALQSEEKNLQDVIASAERAERNAAAAEKNSGNHLENAKFHRELVEDLKIAVQDAKVLLPQPGRGTADLADQLGPMHGAVPQAAMPRNANYKDAPDDTLRLDKMVDAIAAFRAEVASRLAALRSEKILSYLDPQQSPEEYRALVAAYYERISREAKAAPAP